MGAYVSTRVVTADANGLIGPVTIGPAVGTDLVYVGTVSAIALTGTPAATAGVTWTASYGGAPVTSWYGTAPGGPFVVDGDATLTVTGQGGAPGQNITLTYTGSLVPRGTAVAPTAAPTTVFTTITGAVSITGPIAIAGTVDVSGTVAISGPVTVSGAVTVSGNVGVTGPVAISGPVTVTSVGSITETVLTSIEGTELYVNTISNAVISLPITATTNLISLGLSNPASDCAIRVTGNSSGQQYFFGVMPPGGRPQYFSVDGAVDTFINIQPAFGGVASATLVVCGFPGSPAIAVVAPSGNRLRTRPSPTNIGYYAHVTTTGSFIELLAPGAGAESGLVYNIGTISVAATSNGIAYFSNSGDTTGVFGCLAIGPTVSGVLPLGGHQTDQVTVLCTVAAVIGLTYTVEDYTT